MKINNSILLFIILHLFYILYVAVNSAEKIFCIINMINAVLMPNDYYTEMGIEYGSSSQTHLY